MAGVAEKVMGDASTQRRAGSKRRITTWLSALAVLGAWLFGAIPMIQVARPPLTRQLRCRRPNCFDSDRAFRVSDSRCRQPTGLRSVVPRNELVGELTTARGIRTRVAALVDQANAHRELSRNLAHDARQNGKPKAAGGPAVGRSMPGRQA
jgi:hypothetical protein